MANGKTKEKKNRTISKKRAVETDKDEEVVPKKIIEADTPIILPELEEKIVDEEIPAGTEDEESEETPTLDEEDLNPFGDKWEQ